MLNAAIIRSARQSDSIVISDLLIASGSQSLSALFDIDAHCHSNGFISTSLTQKNGQFGYANHWVAEWQGRPIGLVSAWYRELGQDFHQATFQSVVEYFGMQHSIDVFAKSQQLREFIPEPNTQEWCVGHLAVEPSCQRQGIASQLLDYMAQLALKNGKAYLSLDVPVDNKTAVAFYLGYGFEVLNINEVSIALQKQGFTHHLHMQKLI